MNKTIIGLTGGIASGKSTVSKHFQMLGITVVDADLIARQVVAPNTIALQRIETHFGADILLQDGQLDRAKLRSLVFSDEQHKTWLNNLLHPLIRTEIHRQLAAADSAYVLLDAPLLFENNLDAICTTSLVVDVPESIQLERALKRDKVNAEQIKHIIAAQMPTAAKRERAQFVINNSHTVDHTHQQVEQLHSTFLEIAAKK